MRKLGIDYGDARVGIAITDSLGITAQGLETIHHKGNDKIVLKRLEEIVKSYEIDTFKNFIKNTKMKNEGKKLSTVNHLSTKNKLSTILVDNLFYIFFFKRYMAFFYIWKYLISKK